MRGLFSGLSPKGPVPPRNSQRGYLLVTVVVTLFLVASIAMLLNHDSAISANTANKELEAAQAEYVMAAGLQHAQWRAANNACMGDVTIPQTSIGQDSYEAWITGAAAGTAYTLPADQDAWIRNDDVTRNNGTTVSNHLRFQTGNIEQILTRFDLSSLPANAQISAATAWFHIKALKPHPAGPITVHKVTADWVETAVTWESFDGSYRPERVAMIPAQDTGDVWVSVNLTGLVQAWVNGQQNYGILFNSIAEGVHPEYTAREDGTNPPRLDVVVGSGSASPVQIKAKGTLASGITRVSQERPASANQPPGSVTLQLGTDPGADAMLDSFYERNYGSSDYVQINADPGFTQRPVLRFDMGSLPTGAMVSSAVLEMRLLSLSIPGTAAAHELTRGFEEGTKTGGGTADGATWNTYDGTNNWANAGGEFIPAAVAETAIVSTDTWVSWDVTELARRWLAGEPNNGLLFNGADGLDKAKFASREDADPTLRPKLTITYACECGSSCMAPQGSGNVLMVIGNSPANPSGSDDYLRDRFESWGYTVSFIQDDNSQANFDTAASNNDVVYVSDSVASTNVGTKLTSASIGVVNQEGALNDELGIATGTAQAVGKQVNITDASHYITSVFATGPLDIYAKDMEGLITAGTEAPQRLADWGGAGALLAVDAGAPLAAGGTSAGRRAMVPLGRDSTVNLTQLNNNGWLIVQRSLAWGMNANAGASGDLLLVVGNAADLSNKDADRKALMESWGYQVALIDDGDSQANFDAEVAANDVVYVSNSIVGQLDNKLDNTVVGIVNEDPENLDNFGFGSQVPPNTVTADIFTGSDAAHYISEPFAGASVTQFTSNITMPIASGSLASGMQAPGSIGAAGMLVTLDTGAERWDSAPSPGRRVNLPFGPANISQLTPDGLTLMQRSIEWAGGEGPNLGPIAHWKMDETSGITVADSVGGHDGTLTNGPTWSPGTLDGGLTFDGSNDFVSVPHHQTLSLTEKMTFIAWASTNDNSGGYKAIIANDVPGNGASNYWFGMWNGELVFGFWADGGFREVRTSGVGISEGSWTHLAASFNNVTNEVLLYVNGTQVISGSLAWEITTESADLWIGHSVDGEYWDGVLDDLRIYDRALSPDEIAELATLPGPFAHWKLDDGVGTTAVDSEGGHDGTLANGPAWVVGQLGDALNFDGSNDYVDLTSDAELDDVFDSGATAMAWIYPTGWGGNGYGRIFDKSSSPSATNDGWVVRMNVDNSGIINFGQGFSGGRGWWAIPNGSINLNTWQHIAVAYDASSTANDPVIYLNGSPMLVTEKSTPSGTVRSDAALNLRLGNHATGTSWSFDGKIDDARIYDHMLDAADIADIAGGGGGGGGGGCSGNFRDEFNSVSFGNNDGTLTWAGDWLEVGESDGPASNDVRVRNDNGPYQLWLRDNQNGGEGAEREADLSGASSAMLSFDYRRSGLDNSNDYVKLEISANGAAGPWTEEARFQGPGTDSNYTPFSLDISSYISANTRIRLITSPSMGNMDLVIFDNVNIACSP